MRVTILIMIILLITGCSETSESSKDTADIKKIPESSIRTESPYGDLPKMDKEIKLSMAMEVTLQLPAPDSPSLVIANTGSETFLVDSEYLLEKNMDGVWYQVPLTEIDLDGKIVLLGPGGVYEQKVKFPQEERALDKGKYRVVKVLQAKDREDEIVLAHELNKK